MTKKKGKLMTFLWSLIPGAGEMYLGFFKSGISLMASFLALLAIPGFLQLNFLTFLSPIVWFYSFFHTNNLNSLPDDEFYVLEDDYILHLSDFVCNREMLKKHRKILAGCLIFFGISILWSNITRLIFWHLLPMFNLADEAVRFIRYIGNTIPQTVVAVAIIIAGVYLIKGKYQDLKDDNSYIPDPPYLEKKEES